LRRSVAGLTGQVRKYEHRARQAAYLARIGRLFLDAPDEILERFIQTELPSSTVSVAGAIPSRPAAAIPILAEQRSRPFISARRKAAARSRAARGTGAALEALRY
jgi:hypothetical protein